MLCAMQAHSDHGAGCDDDAKSESDDGGDGLRDNVAAGAPLPRGDPRLGSSEGGVDDSDEVKSAGESVHVTLGDGGEGDAVSCGEAKAGCVAEALSMSDGVETARDVAGPRPPASGVDNDSQMESPPPVGAAAPAVPPSQALVLIVSDATATGHRYPIADSV
jgi:hypothetical protein